MQNELLNRHRINTLLQKAARKPLTIVCAGMGCGKTRAVYDFTRDCQIPTAWIQITEMDNSGPRLWEQFVQGVSRVNRKLAGEFKKMGFPDTEDKLNLYLNMMKGMSNSSACIFVLDDFHLLKDSAVLKFMERSFNNLPKNVSNILVTRELPQINISSLMMRGNIYIINEAELNFTESEIGQLLVMRGLTAEISSLKKIYSDTKGWALLVGFVMRMLEKSPGYMGYVNDAIKYDVLQLIKMSVWDVVSDRCKHFLLCLSLVKHHTAELTDALSGNDESLIAELKTLNSFIRFNSHMAFWHIHPILLDFLSARQNLLSDEEVQRTYKIAADWCNKNNFVVDALFYYEKTGDYEMIASILLEHQPPFLEENAQLLSGIFERAPENVPENVIFFAALHVQVVFYTGGLEKALELAGRYESKYLLLPKKNKLRNRMLGSVYYIQGFLRFVESTFTDRYDFDQCIIKLNECFNGFSADAKCWYQHSPGLWTNLTGVSRAGAPREFADAMARSSPLLQKCANGLTAGFNDLCSGELLFYQGRINEAKVHFGKAAEIAADHAQFVILHRAMFYTMRIAVFEGDSETAELILKKMEELPLKNECFVCIINSEHSIAWFYCVLDLPDKIPNWLKENFVPYKYASSIENFGNHIKARYCYLSNNYSPLLAFMEEKKQRESILFERVEMLAMEACVHHNVKDKNAAFSVLREAWEAASPNGIVMPFIELGKDMRSLIHAAEKESGLKIPQEWLSNIKRMASLYSRNREQIVSDYTNKNDPGIREDLTPKEKMVLREMCKGFSNSDIAAKMNLSINTIKMHIGNIYIKLNAHKKADIFRIAAEQNLLSAP